MDQPNALSLVDHPNGFPLLEQMHLVDLWIVICVVDLMCVLDCQIVRHLLKDLQIVRRFVDWMHLVDVWIVRHLLDPMCLLDLQIARHLLVDLRIVRHLLDCP